MSDASILVQFSRVQVLNKKIKLELQENCKHFSLLRNSFTFTKKLFDLRTEDLNALFEDIYRLQSPSIFEKLQFS